MYAQIQDKKKKTVGGRNGYGAKLTNIYSTKFVIETADSKRKLVYKQRWRNNMSECDDPKVISLDHSYHTLVALMLFSDTHFDYVVFV